MNSQSIFLISFPIILAIAFAFGGKNATGEKDE